MISVCMAFRNEGVQVRKTIESCLKSLHGKSVEFVVVNDASDDGIDYKKELADYPNIKYILNPSRLGSSASKQLSVESASYNKVLLVDAHMRFIDDKWYDVVNSLDADSKIIYALYTIGFNADTEELKELTHNCCWIGFNDKKLWGSTWATKTEYEGDIIPVAGLMGAAYFFTKQYWNFLRGYEGLRLYGREEEYISIKSWGMGDGCRLVKNCKIAHLYRDVAPQPITTREVWYNILFIAHTLLPYEITELIIDKMLNKYPQICNSNKLDNEKVKELNHYYRLNGYSYDRFDKINRAVKKLNYQKDDRLITYAERITIDQENRDKKLSR